MFTGIIQSVGQIESVTSLGHGVRLRVHAGGLDLTRTQLGDSIAINGACMTAVECTDSHFSVEVSAHSLSVTTGLDRIGPVNLEPALRIGDALGGHFVSGHVDGIATIVALEPHAESWHLAVAVPVALAGYMASKGSLTLQGVSLTINEVLDQRATSGDLTHCTIHLNLIPHTMAHTTFSRLQAHDKINLEIDLLARYQKRLSDQKFA